MFAKYSIVSEPTVSCDDDDDDDDGDDDGDDSNKNSLHAAAMICKVIR